MSLILMLFPSVIVYRGLCCAQLRPKISMYMVVCLALHAGFTPLCFSIDGMFDNKHSFSINLLIVCLQNGRDHAMWWWVRFSQALICCPSDDHALCMGPQSRWRSLGSVDGGSWKCQFWNMTEVICIWSYAHYFDLLLLYLCVIVWYCNHINANNNNNNRNTITAINSCAIHYCVILLA